MDVLEEMTDGQKIAIEHEVRRVLLKSTASEAREAIETSRADLATALAALLAKVDAHAQVLTVLRRRNEAHGGDPHERVDGIGDWSFEIVGPLRQRLARIWQAQPDAFDSLLKAVCAR